MIKLLFYLLCALTLCTHPTDNYLFEQGLRAFKEKNFSVAVHHFAQAVEQNPTCMQTRYNYAYMLKENCQYQQACDQYLKILAENPGYTHAHIGIAQAYLALGNYQQGWHELEWRLGTPPAWATDLKKYVDQYNDLTNKIILIRAEWGAGDMIQFIRYAQLLKNKGAQIVVHTLHDWLVPLLELQPYIDQVVGPNQSPPPFHFQVPLLSLPIVFATTLETVPAQIPYIVLPQTKIEHHKKSFQPGRFKIGICWQGNTIHGAEKFMPLNYFAQLADTAHVQLYSLQQAHGFEQLDLLENKKSIIRPDTLENVVDLAACISNLDLVITVDTSVAHIAGALGKNVWVVLPVKADWRWLLDRETTPWYPTMRLFRQKEVGSWQPVVDHMQAKLRNLLSVGGFDTIV